jgi:hypothetical protein
MYIDASAIIEIGKVIGAIMVICGLPISIYKWYSRQNEQDIEIKKSYAVGRTGTVSVASVPTGFRPVSIVAVSSGQQGPDGNICMMGTTVKLAANDEISLSGTWLTGDKLTS